MYTSAIITPTHIYALTSDEHEVKIHDKILVERSGDVDKDLVDIQADRNKTLITFTKDSYTEVTFSKNLDVCENIYEDVYHYKGKYQEFADELILGARVKYFPPDYSDLTYVVGVSCKEYAKYILRMKRLHLNCQLVDYWPSPLTYESDRKDKFYVNVVETDDGGELLQLWYERTLIIERRSDSTLPPEKDVANLLGEFKRVKVDKNSPIALYLPESKRKGLWKSLDEKNILNDMDTSKLNGVDLYHPYWGGALGMLHRWIEQRVFQNEEEL